MHGVLLRRSGAVAEVPMPAGDVAIAAVAETYGARVGHYGKRPVALHRLPELFLQGHQREEPLHRGIAEHPMMF